MANRPTRLHYFDMLKGIAIFMVVMGHVITFCVREIDSTPLFKFIGQIHMPLFFFISGWFGFRTLTANIGVSVVNRFKQLIVPMVVVSSIWIFYFDHSGLTSPLVSTFDSLWHGTFKHGYWFTLVLFQIIVVQLLANPIFRRFPKFYQRLLTSFIIWGVLYALTLCNTGAVDILSLKLVASFWPAYIAGFLAASKEQAFNQLLTSNVFITICFVICAPLLYVLCWYWEFPEISEETLTYLVSGIFHIPLACIAFAAVKPWAERAYLPTASSVTRTIAGIWSLLGRKSLAIYLLHYFFLFNLSAIRPTLEAVKLSFVPSFFVSAIVAAGIIAVVLMFERIIATSPLLGWLLTGTTMKSSTKTPAKAS